MAYLALQTETKGVKETLTQILNNNEKKLKLNKNDIFYVNFKKEESGASYCRIKIDKTGYLFEIDKIKAMGTKIAGLTITLNVPAKSKLEGFKNTLSAYQQFLYYKPEQITDPLKDINGVVESVDYLSINKRVMLNMYARQAVLNNADKLKLKKLDKFKFKITREYDKQNKNEYYRATFTLDKNHTFEIGGESIESKISIETVSGSKFLTEYEEKQPDFKSNMGLFNRFRTYFDKPICDLNEDAMLEAMKDAIDYSIAIMAAETEKVYEPEPDSVLDFKDDFFGSTDDDIM